MKCPICGSININDIVHRTRMPVYQNCLFDTEKDAKECTKKDIDMVICMDCGFVYNDSFDDTLDLYNENYNNAQSASENFLEYMKSSIEYLWDKYYREGEEPHRICEIGCGKEADYLKLIYEKIHTINEGEITDLQIIGYDPSSCYYNDEIIKIYPRYFDLNNEECNGIDLLISRHVVEHLNNPLLLFKNVYGLSKCNNSLAFFETPDVEWIFKNNVVFDFAYEHCSLFSKASIFKVAEILNINPLEIKIEFGGQYMWAIMKNESYILDKSEFCKSKNNVLALANKYAKQEDTIFRKIRDMLIKKRKNGKVIVWGAAGKANVFLNLFDSAREIIEAAIDINPRKWGKYIGGTGHCIVSPAILERKEIRTVIIMNNNYYDEIVEEIHKMNTAVDDIIALESCL
ncbi:MAG: methyltransferase domain-containing protein [Lachnospiraceae bacterium]|nr:methyltransferase domain-containing protein [Lachnospiraceae bacterium]